MLRFSNRLSWVSIGALLLCFVVPASVQGQGEEVPINIPVPVAGGFAVQRLLDDVRSATFVPEQLYDPAFNRYVDFGLLGQAWNEKDPGLLTDVALQLAEGERILLRTHKAISADKLFELAVRAATEKNDKAALDRLAKVFEKGGKDKLKAQLSSATKLAGASRAADPMAMVSVHEMTPGTYAIYQNLVKRVQAARIGGNRDSLKDIEQATNDAVELSDKQREYLLKIMSSARAEIPETAKPDPSIELLDRLGDSSRGWLSSATGGRISTPTSIRKIAPNGISFTPREDSASRLYPITMPAPSQIHINSFNGQVSVTMPNGQRRSCGRAHFVRSGTTNYWQYGAKRVRALDAKNTTFIKPAPRGSR